MRRYDEPGAWYAMLPLEVVYAFDPVPPPPAAHHHCGQQQQQQHAGAEADEAADEAAPLEEDDAGAEKASMTDRCGSGPKPQEPLVESPDTCQKPQKREYWLPGTAAASMSCTAGTGQGCMLAQVSPYCHVPTTLASMLTRCHADNFPEELTQHVHPATQVRHGWHGSFRGCLRAMRRGERWSPGGGGRGAYLGPSTPPPPPPSGLLPPQDVMVAADAAESMESAEAPQPMSLSRPGRGLRFLPRGFAFTLLEQHLSPCEQKLFSLALAWQAGRCHGKHASGCKALPSLLVSHLLRVVICWLHASSLLSCCVPCLGGTALLH